MPIQRLPGEVWAILAVCESIQYPFRNDLPAVGKNVRTHFRAFVRIGVDLDGERQAVEDFVIDTGADLTVIPAAFADLHKIPYSRDPKFHSKMQGATSPKLVTSFNGDVRLVFPGLEHLGFQSGCLFSDEIDQPVLGLTSILQDFIVSTEYDPINGTHGFMIRLKANHSGEFRVRSPRD